MADQLKWHVSPSDKSEGGGMFWIEQDGTDAGLATLHVANAFGGTTDEQWDGVVAHISAAPEMLTVLREVDRHFNSPHDLTYEGLQGLRNAVTAVLAKAEPPRKVKHKVTVEVEVEVETQQGVSDDAVMGLASEAVRLVNTVAARCLSKVSSVYEE